MDTWLSTTTDMLRSTSIPLAEIATSAKVELRWLYKFRDGYFNDPGVTKVQRIHDFLMKQGGNGMESPEHGTECPTRSSEVVTLLRLPHWKAELLRKAARRNNLSINKFVSLCVDDALYEGRRYDNQGVLRRTIGKKED